MTNIQNDAVQGFIKELDVAVSRGAGNMDGTCQLVKAALTELIKPGRDVLPVELLRPRSDSYARHLLHRDPAGRFCVIVMVWGEGQGTPIHDHGGLWCVECVYRGRIRVRSYDRGPDEADGVTFREAETLVAGCGEAGHLIPPVDYHVIDNPFGQGPSSTVHVYGGDMVSCSVFEQVGEGRYQEQTRSLSYDA